MKNFPSDGKRVYASCYRRARQYPRGISRLPTPAFREPFLNQRDQPLYRCAIAQETLVCGRHASGAQSDRAVRSERGLPPGSYARRHVGTRVRRQRNHKAVLSVAPSIHAPEFDESSLPQKAQTVPIELYGRFPGTLKCQGLLEQPRRSLSCECNRSPVKGPPPPTGEVPSFPCSVSMRGSVAKRFHV